MFQRMISWLNDRRKNVPRLPHWAGVRGAGQVYVKDVNAMLDDPKTQQQLEILRKLDLTGDRNEAKSLHKTPK